MDRVREMIFNILGEAVQDAIVLDLFAGSGSLGFEALSRGAQEVIFVEKGGSAQKTIRQNLRNLGLHGRAFLLGQDIFRALRRLKQQGKKFSLIFLDPPYNQGLVKKVLLRLDQSDIVAPFAQLVLHRSRQETSPAGLAKLKLLREKPVGQACLSFFLREE